MPRGPRIVLPGFPHHVVHRGHNRRPVFDGDGERRYYLRNLREGRDELGCKVHAYCLMSNHVHLVVDPGEDSGALALLMKRVAARQTRLVNSIHGRCGTLWEGRYKSTPIASDEYLLACCRYVELNPVRAGMVDDPIRYRWSSHRQRAGCHGESWIDPDPSSWSLGSGSALRAKRYREWVRSSTVPAGQWKLFKESVRCGRVKGGADVARTVARSLGARILS